MIVNSLIRPPGSGPLKEATWPPPPETSFELKDFPGPAPERIRGQSRGPGSWPERRSHHVFVPAVKSARPG